MSDERSADQACRWYKVWQVLLQKILTILLQRATSTTLLQSATIIKVRQIKAHWKNTESVWPCKISKIKVPSRALNLTSFGNKKGKTSRAKTSLLKTTVTLVCITYVNISFAYTVTNCVLRHPFSEQLMTQIETGKFCAAVLVKTCLLAQW